MKELSQLDKNLHCPRAALSSSTLHFIPTSLTSFVSINTALATQSDIFNLAIPVFLSKNVMVSLCILS